ncbi:MAG: glycerol-3-phosphate acyltransferase [Ruminococcus sp.]|nr:glycerol-3-phosphate acyltransferase [Oscillospiraceae bacterium]
MTIIFSIILGYIIGCINPSYILALARGFDIREVGSGNAGASNAIITMGKKIGAISAFFDIFKAFFAVKLSVYLFPALNIAGIISGTSCIIGHIFPVFMKFRGGKGLACLGGLVLAYSVPLFFILLVAEVIIGFSLDYICVVPITGSIAFPVIYYIIERNIAGVMVLLVATAVMLYKHIENIKRIKNGTEARLSFLWKGDEEIARIQRNANVNKH